MFHHDHAVVNGLAVVTRPAWIATRGDSLSDIIGTVETWIAEPFLKRLLDEGQERGEAEIAGSAAEVVPYVGVLEAPCDTADLCTGEIT